MKSDTHYIKFDFSILYQRVLELYLEAESIMSYQKKEEDTSKDQYLYTINSQLKQ
ncbi:conserved hypothetical protein [Histoplasma capsulatum var. duboisii H88]|uniref:Uncharacterized protein n=1 Tax=Ajellomyces capsulatus (strain H88) TaxID=544711 RepID=F0UFX8_AJEC8|nr:conserved hypothetical protein [Histoplasma capsulatum var. duboisii H88]